MTDEKARATIPEEVLRARLAQSEQMREFFIEMWKQNPALAKQGGARVQSLLTPLACDAEHGQQQNTAAGGMVNQRGVSLIELIMFIVIIGVALAGILLVMNQVTRGSADPLVHKQSLAIAESLLEEVALMPFTFCDPDDPNAASAVVAAVAANGCAATVEAIGPETIGIVTEDRYGTAAPAVNAQFDNASDYDGFAMNAGNGGVRDVTGAAIAALNGYSASVAVTESALPNVAAKDTLLVTVTVTGPDNVPVVVEGIRTRYAPRALP